MDVAMVLLQEDAAHMTEMVRRIQGYSGVEAVMRAMMLYGELCGVPGAGHEALSPD